METPAAEAYQVWRDSIGEREIVLLDADANRDEFWLGVTYDTQQSEDDPHACVVVSFFDSDNDLHEIEKVVLGIQDLRDILDRYEDEKAA